MHGLRLETPRHTLDRCLGLRLQRAARVVARRLDEALRPLDLTNGQFELLALLRQTPAQGIASVAERLGRDRTTITAILKPLKQRGLVAVTVNTDDSRGLRLSLTRSGSDLLAAAIPHWGRFHAHMEHQLMADEVDLLRLCLGRLSKTQEGLNDQERR